MIHTAENSIGRSPSVNIAVCGRFHYHNYVRYLESRGVLARFYYSARWSENGPALGIPASKAVNAFLKEYAVQLHSRLLGSKWRVPAFSRYHSWWQQGVLRRWSKADLLHIMLHGNARPLIERAHADGASVIGEPVNSHPAELCQLLNEENERLGIPEKQVMDLLEQRRAEEALQCDHLLAGSQFVADSFVRQGFPGARAHVIPYGVDSRYFTPLSNEEKNQAARTNERKSFRVICVAGIHPRKGHIYLIRAWMKLNLPDSELLLIGHMTDPMKRVLAPYTGVFRHIDHVPNRQLRRYYGSSDLFVLPSIEDGFAYVCAEAMGCGLPVIATVNTGAAELIDEGINGFRVPIRSEEALAEKIQLLYEDNTKKCEMGVAAENKARLTMGWEQYAKELVAFYCQIADNKTCN